MTQAAFAAALLDPARPVPAGLLNPVRGGGAGRRFDIYRNNVAVGLCEALAQAFPAVRRLVGEAFFAAMAGVFVRAVPPSSPVLPLYGGDFPDFLAGFAPVAHLGYLPDVARLELALRQSYHAADAAPLARAGWAAVSPGELARARLRFLPAVRLLRSDWPVLSVWRATLRDAPAPVMRRPGEVLAEDVLVVRPGFDPEPLAPPGGSGPVLAALLAGDAFGDALDAAGPGFDLTAFLAFLIATPVCQALATED